jgi:hypothetical protein
MGELTIQEHQEIVGEFERSIRDFCNHVAGPCKVKAICQSDDYTAEAPALGSPVEVLVILNDYQTKIMSYVRLINGRNVVFFVVDQWIFERDVQRGFLGEALASLLIFRTCPLIIKSICMHKRCFEKAVNY